MDNCQHDPVFVSEESQNQPRVAFVKCRRCGIATARELFNAAQGTQPFWERWAKLMVGESAARELRSVVDQGRQVAPSEPSIGVRVAQSIPTPDIPKFVYGPPADTAPFKATYTAKAPDIETIRERDRLIEINAKAACWDAFLREALPKDQQRWREQRSTLLAEGMGREFKRGRSLMSLCRNMLGPNANIDTLATVLTAARRFRNVLDNATKKKEKENENG